MNEQASTERIEPFLQFCVFCDAFATTPEGKPVFVGVFDSLKKPSRVPQFLIILRWIGGMGEHDVRLRILNPDLNEIFAQPNQKIILPHKAQGAQAVYQFVNFAFAGSGVYWVEISVNNNIYAAIPLPVYE